MRYMTLAGEEVDRVQAAPADPLADVRAQLLAGRLSRVLGSTFAAADAVLPGRRAGAGVAERLAR